MNKLDNCVVLATTCARRVVGKQKMGGALVLTPYLIILQLGLREAIYMPWMLCCWNYWSFVGYCSSSTVCTGESRHSLLYFVSSMPGKKARVILNLNKGLLLQVCICSLPSIEEMWDQRPYTSAFLWQLQRGSKDGEIVHNPIGAGLPVSMILMVLKYDDHR